MMLQNRLLQGNTVAGAAPVPVAPHLSGAGRVAPITAAASSGAAAPSPVLTGKVCENSRLFCCVHTGWVGVAAHPYTLDSLHSPLSKQAHIPALHYGNRRVGDVAVAAAPSKAKDAEGKQGCCCCCCRDVASLAVSLATSLCAILQCCLHRCNVSLHWCTCIVAKQ